MKERQAYYDNLKFILMLFVVFGHFAFEYRNESWMISICNSIYTFHMPVFIFVSGYFSRNINTQRWIDVWSLLLPYFLLELVHWAYTKFTGLGYGNKSLLTPTYHNWYLLSLFYWRMLIPFFKHFDRKMALSILFALSLLAGWIPQLTDFAASYRSLYFFPVFALGYYSDDISVEIKNQLKYRWLAFLLLALFVSFIFISSVKDKDTAEQLLYAYAPMYGYYGETSNLLLRLAALFSGLGCGYLVLHLIPHTQKFYTRLGANTLYIYVLHMFIVWPIIRYGIDYSPISTMIISLISSIIICFILSQDIVRMIFRPLLDPQFLINKFKTKS